MPPTNPYQNNSINPYVHVNNINSSPSFWNRKSTRIGIVVTIVVIIIIVVVAIVQQGKSSQSIANQFVSNTIKGNATKSYQLTTQSFHSTTSLSVWADDVKAIDAQCSGNSTLIHESLQSKVVVKEYGIKALGGGTCHINIDLVNNSGKWLINSIVSNL